MLSYQGFSAPVRFLGKMDLLRKFVTCAKTSLLGDLDEVRRRTMWVLCAVLCLFRRKPWALLMLEGFWLQEGKLLEESQLSVSMWRMCGRWCAPLRINVLCQESFLLKNGKRSKGDLLLSQARGIEIVKGGVGDGEGEGIRETDSGVVSEAEEEVEEGQAPRARKLVAGDSVSGKGPGHSGLGSNDVAFRSRLICDLNSLRNDMRDLRSDVAALKRPPPPTATTSPSVGFCFLFVRLLSHSGERLGTTLLERLLDCEILHYQLLKSGPIPSFKVKVAEGMVLLQLAVEMVVLWMFG